MEFYKRTLKRNRPPKGFGIPVKKAKLQYENAGEFAEDDEVTLTFPNEDSKQLFFSQFILARCSPVFKAMFEHDFKEKKERNVDIVDIKMEDFNTFLKWCDPMISERLTAENVIRMVEIADKYQMESRIQQCKQVMNDDILDKIFQDTKYKIVEVPDVNKVVEVLLVATKYNYPELLKKGEDYIVCFEVQDFINKEPFEKLPLDLKYRIVSRRMMKDTY